MQRTPLHRFATYVVLACTPVFFVACDDDDDDPVVPTTSFVTDAVVNDARFGTLESLVVAQGLATTLSDANAEYTVFAPNDAAFAAVDLSGLNDMAVRNTLLYHVFSGQEELTSTVIGDGFSLLETATDMRGPNNSRIVAVVEKTTSGVTVNGVDVIDADIQVDNGVIHEIDEVLLVPNVAMMAQSVSALSSLVSALLAADASPDFDFVNTLGNPDGQYTVFAPTNTAFADETRDNGADVATLGAVLGYHVVAGANLRAEDLAEGDQTVMTLQGQMLTVNKTGSAVTVSDGTNTFDVVIPNVQTSNGVVHVIDGVLFPTL